jgi:hypothetical protein
VFVSAQIKVAPRTNAGLHTGKRPHPVRGLCGHVNRWRCFRFCALDPSQCEHACPLGAGSPVTDRGGAALSAGVSGKAPHNPPHIAPRCGCLVGDGRGVALRSTRGRDRRGLGDAASRRLHRHTPAGDQGRSRQHALLADPPGGHARSERCPQPLACRLAAIAGPSARSPSPRCPALAGRTLPRASGAARHLGGNP